MNITEKRIYESPQIDRVELDYEISLVLQSVGEDPDPAGDPE